MTDDTRQDEKDEAAIVFEEVVKSFGDRKVLDGISFSVAAGEALCILGRSGTGKSVTLKLMIGLLQADSGKVMVMGNDVASLDREGLSKMRRKMGFLFQSAALFSSFSVRDNLALPLHRLDQSRSKEEIERAVSAALSSVGLEKRRRQDGGRTLRRNAEARRIGPGSCARA